MKNDYNADKTGYQEDFLGNNIIVPIPKVSLEHQVLESEKLKEGFIADFCHYSGNVKNQESHSSLLLISIKRNSKRILVTGNGSLTQELGLKTS